MARYDMNYSCGHAGEVQLFGPHRQRAARLEWLTCSGLCPACLRAERAAAESQWAADQGLPALAGTPKQIAWAEAIRREKLADLIVFAASLKPAAGEEGFFAAVKEQPLDALTWSALADWYAERGQEQHAAAARGCAWLIGQADAGWWIDHRDQPGRLLLREAARVNLAAK